MSAENIRLTPGEQVVALVRQHPLVLAKAVVLNIATFAVLIGLSAALHKYWLLVFGAPAVAFLGWEILARRKREFLLTDRRVIRQEGLLQVTSFEAPLDKINNVFHKQSLAGRLLNYGDVGLETASEEGVVHFRTVPDPVQFKNRIMHQRSLAPVPGTGAARGNIPKLIEDLASLRDRGIITETEFETKKRLLLDQL